MVWWSYTATGVRLLLEKPYNQRVRIVLLINKDSEWMYFSQNSIRSDNVIHHTTVRIVWDQTVPVPTSQIIITSLFNTILTAVRYTYINMYTHTYLNNKYLHKKCKAENSALIDD